MASYLGNNPDNIIRVRKGNYRYIATAAQTVFTGVDSNSLTMAVNLSDVEVFLNGVLLDQTDYTATASTITLSAGATLNDIVEVITAADFQVSNLYTKEEVDAKVSVAITDLVGTAGTALNTLGELSDALADDANYAATITTALGTKANSSDVTTLLSAKADTATVNTALALKAPLASPTFTGDVVFNSTSALKLPSGTTAERNATPSQGHLRYNNSVNSLEAYNGTAWNEVNGNVLQVINRTHGGTTQSIPATVNVEVQLSNWSQTITKRQSNSKIVCFIDFYNYQGATSGGWWALKCKVGTSEVTSTYNDYGIRSHNPMQWVWSTSAHQAFQAMFWDIRDQTTITYDFYHRSISTVAAMVWWNNPVTWTFMEIAQ